MSGSKNWNPFPKLLTSYWFNHRRGAKKLQGSKDGGGGGGDEGGGGFVFGDSVVIFLSESSKIAI